MIFYILKYNKKQELRNKKIRRKFKNTYFVGTKQSSLGRHKMFFEKIFFLK